MKKLFMLCCASLLAACSSQTPPAQASLDGEVFYLQRIALPPAATLSVELQDVSLLDAPAVTLARQAGPVKGNVPLPFHLSYDPRQVKPGHRYALSARIELGCAPPRPRCAPARRRGRASRRLARRPSRSRSSRA